MSIYKNYNPDILETIANLSNDEVFTPPKLANEILDLLPEEVWSDSTITFLDPAVKTGIFLREIASRLIDGLAEKIPDLQERVNHILTKQVFGIGITELTTLMARRTVYCSMTANGEFSIVTEFDDEKGNIIFPDTEHTWDKNGRCKYCGANRESYGGGAGRENYAYPFIHDNFEKEFGNMKFDVIIGNPPYQLNSGVEGGNSFLASAVYHEFIEKSISMNPKYITMITPSRWMNGAARGIPNEWIKKMIKDNRIKIVHDYEDSESLFSNVGITGGVNYFLWDKNNNEETVFYLHNKFGEVSKRIGKLDEFNLGIVIRDPNIYPIVEKIKNKHGKYYESSDKNFSGYVSPNNLFNNTKELTTNWRDYKKEKDDEYNIKYYVSKATNGISHGWIKESQIPKNKDLLNLHKIFIPATYGDPIRYDSILGVPRYAEPGSACSQTYVGIGCNKKKHKLTKDECFNIISYINTKFFRFLVRAKKTTQAAARGVYQFVPLQDFSKTWTDEELYEKYKLTQEEIDYIEKIIPPMSNSEETNAED